jgi:hypothetical protein
MCRLIVLHGYSAYSACWLRAKHHEILPFGFNTSCNSVCQVVLSDVKLDKRWQRGLALAEALLDRVFQHSYCHHECYERL